jgi:hypothetical protein
VAWGTGLADGRQWELVSPPDKGGAQVEALNEGEVQAAEGGGAIAYLTTGPITGVSAPEGNTEINSPVLSVRGSKGWGSQDITTGNAGIVGKLIGGGGEYRLFSSDLSLALVEQLAFIEEPPLLAPDASERTEYLRDDAPVAPGPGETAEYAEAKSNGEISAARGEAFGEPGYVPLVSRADTLPGAQFGTACTNYSRGAGPLQCTSRYGDNNVEGATSDLSHVVLHSLAALTAREGTTPAAEARGAEGSLYEFSDGRLQLVSVLPEGKQAGVPVPKTENEFHAYLEGDGPVLGSPNDSSSPTNARNAISSDGSRVIWTEISGDDAQPPWSLYMRDLTKNETVRLDEAAPGVEPLATESEAVFQTANASGSRVFFTDTQKLTPDATLDEESASHHEPDLYVCDMRAEVGGKLACHLKDLTVPVNAGEQADVQGSFDITHPNHGVVLGASEEEGAEAEGGAYVYFVAKGVLSPANLEGRVPVAGGYNLYVDHSRSNEWEKPVFIATLSGEDAADWDAGTNNSSSEGNLTGLTSRVSPDGRFLVFMSDRRLTGYDNVDANSPVGEPHADEEVFEYSAASGELACASCNPTTERQPVGFFDGEQHPSVDRLGLWRDRWLAGLVPGWTALTALRSVYQSRYLSDSGRVFFDSSDALVPADSNVGTENVYEYEPDGVGPETAQCEPAVTSRRDAFKPARAFDTAESEGGSGVEPAGCVGLISSGESSEESAFMDASASGNDVFFITTSQLVKADTDTSYDMYDAHVCTAEAPCSPEQTPPPAPCESRTSCGAPSTQPSSLAAPGSATFTGLGNLAPPPPAKPAVKKKIVKCKKRLVKNKKGRCVKKRKTKKSAHKSAKGRR